VIRGEALFREQTINVSAQMGTSVGVEKEERLSTPILQSLKFRYPWLQINLFTAFLAAGVVSMFQGTIEKVVVLAAFLPVLAGQSGNTGCQALAVALRGLTLGDFGPGEERRVMIKEGVLGFLNGTLVGIVAGIGMFIFAAFQGAANGLTLALIVVAAMIGSCTISGVAGAFIPLALKRLGADPATASSIFVTTATDIGSMGLFLFLAAHFAL
jgi:magnesium transporter